MVAIGLLHGDLHAEHYEDEAASDPRIDALREKMVISENVQFSDDYHDPQKRSIANSMKLVFNDGTASEEISIEYPIGHKRRREEGIPVLIEKFKRNLKTRFPAEKAQLIYEKMADQKTFEAMPVTEFMALWS